VRGLVIESTREFDLPFTVPNVVQYVTRAPNIDGKGAVAETELVEGGLRLLPTRSVLGEALGAEAYDLLNALDSGHNGLVTVHAASPLAALERLAELAAMTRVVSLPAELYRAKVARTIGRVVHCAFRGRDGRLVRHNRPDCLEVFEDAGIAYRWPGDGA
jgi:Flp pilus assembly CpaF family ATPase